MQTIQVLIFVGITIWIFEVIADKLIKVIYLKKLKKKNMVVLYDEHSNIMFLYNEKTGEKTRIN
jgi:lipoprotein signal peptidase